MEIITRNGIKNLKVSEENKKEIEYSRNKKCSVCGKPYMKNNTLPEEIINILGDKIKYIPSCKCHETFYERKIEELSSKSDHERALNRGGRYKKFSAVDLKFINSTFEKAEMTDNLAVCMRYAKAFMTKEIHTGLIFYGNSGTGKTFNSACIGNYLMDRGKSVLVLNLAYYLTNLKAQWSSIETEVLRKVSECDLLIIDDFGAEKITDWVLEKVFLLIDTRYKTEKPVIITTNLEYSRDENCDIEKIFSRRIKDRINEMCYPLCFFGESRRKGAEESFLEIILY